MDQTDWSVVPVEVIGEPCAAGIEALRAAMDELAFARWQEAHAPAELRDVSVATGGESCLNS